MDSNLMILNEPDGQTLYNLSTAQFSIEKRFLVVLYFSSIFPSSTVVFLLVVLDFDVGSEGIIENGQQHEAENKEIRRQQPASPSQSNNSYRTQE